jgi:S-adenosylmethionine:tRNA ribosyltransferase-isomerase
MKTQDFDFNTASNVLPRDPNELRGKSRDDGRMIVLDRSTSTITHTRFRTICDYLRPGDLLVLNDSYVLSDTLWFQCEHERTQVTVCGHEPDGTTIIEIVSPKVRAKDGLVLTSSDNTQLSCQVVEALPAPSRLWKVRFAPAELLLPTLEHYGTRIHLNQAYWDTTPQAYRSVYAAAPGSLEIPSAGLHFSVEMLAQAAAKGVEMAYVTLHVGAAEILAARHISEDEVENHKVRSEYFEVGEDAAARISSAMAERRRVIAVGTTVMRTLETLACDQKARSDAGVSARAGWTGLYIYPGFEFKVVDVLLTSLHQPMSSHIVLTAAFAGTDFVMRSYDEINERDGYEFDMFGDSMLIV